MRTVSGDEIREAFGGLVGRADKEVLRGDLAEILAAAMPRGLERGFSGWVDHDLAFIRDWGFDLRAIDRPVALWQGDDDFMVPRAHSLWLARHIPGSEIRFWPKEGHISLGERHRGQIIEELKKMLNR